MKKYIAYLRQTLTTVIEVTAVDEVDANHRLEAGEGRVLGNSDQDPYLLHEPIIFIEYAEVEAPRQKFSSMMAPGITDAEEEQLAKLLPEQP